MPGASARAPTPAPVPVLHVVTTPELLLERAFAARARAVMAAVGERGALHLRGPGLAARALHALAVTLAAVQRDTGCWLVVNDRLDVALAAGATGVQLTSRSMTPADARRAAPRLRLGASVHAVAEARAAAEGGADWVVAGHVYPTRSHPGEPPRGLQLVRDVAAAVRLPVVAIGGVTPAAVPALRAAGAAGVAVIRGVWAASDAERAATDYLASYDADAAGGRDDRPDGERRATGGA
jgi:thiamine-phosphate diphosphorylase